MLTTLLFPTKGEILWNGENIHALDATYRELVGYLPQDFGYYRHWTPRKFLRYMAALKGVDSRTANTKTDELMKLTGLADVTDKKMGKLSGGMIQRVGIAQSLLGEPHILVLDEPTAGLDPKERVRFRDLIASLAHDRVVILSTHIVSDLETVAHRVIMLKDHKVSHNESPAALCRLLDGKVFETEETRLDKAGGLPLAKRQEGNITLTRFFSDAPPPFHARPVKPNLEDVFLYEYRDGVDLS
jgi:ABC-type multidrug transport system ATPase subunit